MPSPVQRSFNAGELSPQLQGRADVERYASGVGTLRNFIALPHGPATTRPGFGFIDAVKDQTARHRFIPFVYNAAQAYVLVFGPLYMRIVQARAVVETSGVAAWNSGTAYIVGDMATLAGVTYYCIAAHTNHTPVNPTYWYAQAGTIYEIPTTYASADLAALHFVQSADVLTITHPSYPTRELRRYGATRWTLTDKVFGPSVVAPVITSVLAGVASGGVVNPTGLGAVGGNGGLPKDKYVLTAWYGYQATHYILQSPVSAIATSTVGGADGANPVAISWTPAPYEPFGSGNITLTDYRLYKLIGALYELVAVIANNLAAYSDTGDVAILPVVLAPSSPSNLITFTYEVTSIDADTGEESLPSAAVGATGLEPSTVHPNVITWPEVSGVEQYNVYRDYNGVFGFIGTARGVGTIQFRDPISADSTASIVPDAASSPPVDNSVLTGAGNRAACAAYCQQRLVLAGSDNHPEDVSASQIGRYDNYLQAVPIRADSAIFFRVAGREVNAVRSMLELAGSLVILTAGGVFEVSGDVSGAFTPESVNPRQRLYEGAGTLAPILIGDSALYVRYDGSTVADLRYNSDSESFNGSNLCVYSPHLFEGMTLTDSAYQRYPFSIPWYVRDDGVLLGLTYVPGQKVAGWHRHDTGDGDEFEQVCCIPEGTETALYALVKRTVGGVTKRYIECMKSRLVTDIADAFCVDSGLTYDGWNEGATALTLSGGTDWTSDEELTLTASVALFTAGDVGNAFHLVIGDVTLRCLVLTFTDTQHVTVRAELNVPVAFQGVATDEWAAAVDEVSGIDHLEGRTVAILADGCELPEAVVVAGAVSLDRPYAKVHVGLPIVADLGMLEVEDLQGPTLIEQPKNTVRVAVMVDASGGGLWVGSDEDHLQEAQWRDQDEPGTPPALRTGVISIALDSAWLDNGRVLLRQRSPLPLTILAVSRTGEYGEK